MRRRLFAVSVAILLLGLALCVAPSRGEDSDGRLVLPATRSAGAKGVDERKLLPLPLELPRVAATCIGLWGPPRDTTVDPKAVGVRRGPFLVPAEVKLLSLNKKATLSDENPPIGDPRQITDGAKEHTSDNVIELAPGVQWAQIDLRQSAEVFAIVLWHYHAEARVYRDVIVQVSDDPEFKAGVTTLFNNDQDNSAKLGAGKDREYLELNEGMLVDGRGVRARYVRCYSNGNTSDTSNHYIEVEVWGMAAKVGG